MCSGYDGIGTALNRIFPALRTIAHVEIEAFAIANLVAKMEAGEMDSCPVYSDVKEFPFEELRGIPDTILSAGFPCQPWSAAGRRAGIEDPRHIYPFIAEGISKCRPALVFLENVEGIISCKLAKEEETSVLKYVLEDLESRGYETSWGVFSAAEVGAPHQRKRVFVLAKLADSRRQPGEIPAAGGHPGVERSGGDGEDGTTWPARPNEAQHDWEEPRVVGDAGSTIGGNVPRSERRPETQPESGDPGGEPREAASNETKSELGRTSDGRVVGLDPTAHRVDRLRLLGNGVVPATAEKAFRTLFDELNHADQEEA